MNALMTSQADRSSKARAVRNQLDRPGWLDSIISEGTRVADQLSGCAADELRCHTNRLRLYARTMVEGDLQRLLVLAVGGVLESVRRTKGLRLFQQQLRAGVIVSCGAVAEMQTGEGKTLAVALPAYFHALAGRGVHVATPNSYLAGRDNGMLAPVFSALGMTVGLLRDQASREETRSAYRADVTYGPGHAFGFDYLRDQLTLDRINASPLGQRLYARLCDATQHDKRLQRGLHAAIVDEIDHVLIDDAASPLLLSGNRHGESPDADVHRAALELAAVMRLEIDFQNHHNGGIALTDAGFDRVYAEQKWALHSELIRPWHEYVILALRARYAYRPNIDYVIRNQQVQIVDRSTGRIFEDRTWSDGLHQAIEAKENLTIRCESVPLAKITRQRFFRYYESIGGMTGTAAGCKREFATVYGLAVAEVPLRIPTRRVILHNHISLTQSEKFAAIAEEARSMHQSGRAVLIGTLHIAESLAIADELRLRELCFELLNGIQDSDEATIVAKAGRAGAITVATNLAGRGTDIRLDRAVRDRGGLHVIVTQKHSLARVDRQLIGRCARCGDPGSAREFICAEDRLVADHSPWVARAIMRWTKQGRRGDLPLGNHLRRAQQQQQRLATSLRWRLLQSDRDDEFLLHQSTASPLRCCQL